MFFLEEDILDFWILANTGRPACDELRGHTHKAIQVHWQRVYAFLNFVGGQ